MRHGERVVDNQIGRGDIHVPLGPVDEVQVHRLSPRLVLLYETPSVAAIRDDFLDTQTKSLMVTLEDCRSISLPHRLLRDLLRLFAPLL